MKIHIGYDANVGRRAIGEIVTKVKAKSVPAMLEATKEFRDDARDKPPKCPRRSGDLYRAHKVKAWRRGSAIIGLLHADKPYAAAVHEGVVGKTHAKIKHWTRPGSGPHWILAKAIRYHKKYIGIARGTLFRKVAGKYG